MATQVFALIDAKGTHELAVSFEVLIAVGFAGRDQAKAMEHINELAELGVKPPSKVPMLYACAAQCLTKEEKIQVVGRESSGEVEFIIVLREGEIFIGLGSDHTDRGLETAGIGKAKQICAKPMAPVVWRYEELKPHWDKLELRAWQKSAGKNGGREFLYQEGSLATILTVERILDYVHEEYPGLRDAVLFSGTVPVKGDFVYGDNFRAELRDPVLGRLITHEYAVEVVGEGLE